MWYVLEKYGVSKYYYVRGARSRETLLKIVRKFYESPVLFRIISYPSINSRNYDMPLAKACRVSYYRYGQKIQFKVKEK